MARLIKSSGEIIPNVDVSNLKRMQDLVQGYVEFVYMKGDKLLICNEEGLIHKLPLNQQASKIYGRPLVGDVIECGLAEIQ